MECIAALPNESLLLQVLRNALEQLVTHKNFGSTKFGRTLLGRSTFGRDSFEVPSLVDRSIWSTPIWSTELFGRHQFGRLFIKNVVEAKLW